MQTKSLYKVVIYNKDRTTIYIVAKSKLDAHCKYSDYIKENYSKDFIDEYQDYILEFIHYIYE